MDVESDVVVDRIVEVDPLSVTVSVATEMTAKTGVLMPLTVVVRVIVVIPTV